MTVLESLPIMLFVMLMVFAVLAVLFLLIALFSFVFQKVGSGKRYKTRSDIEKPAILSSPAPETKQTPDPDDHMIFGGEMVLHNVDEPTAAMIMAIVSDESGIPLSELCFKSIKRKA